MADDGNTISIDEWKETHALSGDDIDKCISEIASGNIEPMRELYSLTSTSVYGLALSVLKNPDDAQDVLHDCYLMIHKSASGYVSQGKPLAWIFTITKNLCLKKIRENSKNTDISDDELEKSLSANDNLSVEDRLVIKECLTELSEEERRIVILHIVSGYKHREIAEFMDIPLSTILSKYNRALKKLKEKITKGDSYDK